MKVVQKKSAAPPKKFTRYNHPSSSVFNNRPQHLRPNTIYLLRPPPSLSSYRPWIISCTTKSDCTAVFRHPLTSKPQLFNLPPNFDFSKLNTVTIAVFYRLSASDQLIVAPTPQIYSTDSVDVRQSALFALYGGGELWGCPAVQSSYWLRLSDFEKLDDIAAIDCKIYIMSRYGRLELIQSYSNLYRVRKTLISRSVNPDTWPFGWRRRLVVDDTDLLLVVRMEEKVFRVFIFKEEVKGFSWDEVSGFKGKRVLFMARDYYFFCQASRKFPGREYKNCIVFSEAAFPQYGKDGWEFTKSGDRQLSEDDIAVFRLDDQVFAREGENSGFPKINWSPPAWIFIASWVSVPADELQCRSAPASFSQLERGPNEARGLKSVIRDENDGEVQSDLKVSNNKDKEKQEELESEFVNQGQDQEGVEFDSASQDQKDRKMQCDSGGQGKHDGGMHPKTNIEGDTSLRDDIMTPSLPAVEQETSGKNITHSIPNDSTSSKTEIHKTGSATTKFVGYDIRSDLMPTLQKIWQKHGNIIEYSIVRNSDITAKALELLATMVRILEDNSALSLSDSQADYLRSTLSDLSCIGFRVCWLSSFVEKALKVHSSKALVESLNNLSQSSSQVKKRKRILGDELAKLNEEENKLKEEMAKVSKMIPFYGQVKSDEPIGVGLT
ncbi:hypothetical protein KSS87_021358 [Heliosperma pusillum]|nr:hypothetical protein KSS87_021358 [Heliosperma pusillum]